MRVLFIYSNVKYMPNIPWFVPFVSNFPFWLSCQIITGHCFDSTGSHRRYMQNELTQEECKPRGCPPFWCDHPVFGYLNFWLLDSGGSGGIVVDKQTTTINIIYWVNLTCFMNSTLKHCIIHWVILVTAST